MGRWRTETERWLSSEQHGQADADEAFARVFAALPAIEPAASFVSQAVEAAWLARARRRRIAAIAAAAAAVLLAAIGGTVVYVLFGAVGGRLLTTAAAVVSGSVVSALTTLVTGVEWWSATAQAGSAVARLIARPQGLAALVATELVGAAALYMLHRMLRSDVSFRNPRAFCF
jgi:hypothetical protein